MPLDLSDLDCAKRFAERMRDTKSSLYRVSPEKVYTDALTGKVGELATHRYLSSQGILERQSTPSDYIEGAYRWEDDFSLPNGSKIHVKTQDANSRKTYGAAWIIGTDPKRRDKRFLDTHQEGDLLVGCFYPGGQTVLIDTIIPVTLIHDAGLLTDEGVLDFWRGKKQRLTLDSILDLGQRFWYPE